MKNKEKQAPEGQGFKQALGGAAKALGGAAKTVEGAALAVKDKAQNVMINAVDANGDHQITVDDLILWGLKVPGACIDRADFLRTELSTKYPPEVVADAIAHNPAHAGIKVMELDIIADDVIQNERNNITINAVALGLPQGPAVAVTIPAELAGYYGAMLRVAQKLMYLYGFPSMMTGSGDVRFDAATVNLLTLCLGVMSGVGGTNIALRAVARSLGKGVQHILANSALTKGVIFPFVRHVFQKFFQKKVTKAVFAGFFGKAIPVAGSLVSGGITYVSFRPCCDRLKDMLRDTYLSDPEHHRASMEEIHLSDAILRDDESHEIAEEYLKKLDGEEEEEVDIEVEAE